MAQASRSRITNNGTTNVASIADAFSVVISGKQNTIKLELSVGGALWDLKGQTGLFANATYEADNHKERATLGRFGSP